MECIPWLAEDGMNPRFVEGLVREGTNNSLSSFLLERWELGWRHHRDRTRDIGILGLLRHRGKPCSDRKAASASASASRSGLNICNQSSPGEFRVAPIAWPSSSYSMSFIYLVSPCRVALPGLPTPSKTVNMSKSTPFHLVSEEKSRSRNTLCTSLTTTHG